MKLEDLEKLDQLGLIYFSVNLSCQNINGEYKKKMYFKEPWSQITTSKFVKSKNAVVVRTGSISDCFVIDVDDETKEQAKALCDLCFKASNVVVKTNKGYHFYFKYDEGFNRTKTYNNYGFDIKGNGGIITAPPSYYRHPDKGWIVYKFIKVNKELSYVSEEIKSYLLKLIAPVVTENITPISDNIININMSFLNNRQEIMFKLLDSLNSNRSVNFNDWIHIGFCLANSGYDVSFWDYFSKRSPGYNKSTNEYFYKRIFDPNKSRNGAKLTENTLWYYLKLDNPSVHSTLSKVIKNN